MKAPAETKATIENPLSLGHWEVIFLSVLSPARQDGSTSGLGIWDTYLCTPGSRNPEQRQEMHRLTWGKS